MKWVYWGCTGLLCLVMFGAGVMNLMGGSEVAGNFRAMGYPAYLPSILGFYKVVAVPALLAPLSPVLKELAYAGVFFVLTGAAISHLAAGQPVAESLPALVVLGLWLGSYLTYEAHGLRPADEPAAV